jgi:hypothetical protein
MVMEIIHILFSHFEKHEEQICREGGSHHHGHHIL